MKRLCLVLAAVLVMFFVQVASAAIRGTGGGSSTGTYRLNPPYMPSYAPSYAPYIDPYGLYGAEHAYKSIPSWYGNPYYPYRNGSPYYVVPKRR